MKTTLILIASITLVAFSAIQAGDYDNAGDYLSFLGKESVRAIAQADGKTVADVAYPELLPEVALSFALDRAQEHHLTDSDMAKYYQAYCFASYELELCQKHLNPNNH